MLAADGFDWDEGNREKCRKHGVSLDEIESLFLGGPRFAPDLGHSGGESRYIAIGRTTEGRPLFVAFTIRAKAGRNLVRPISARFMHAREAARYEASSEPQD